MKMITSLKERWKPICFVVPQEHNALIWNLINQKVVCNSLYFDQIFGIFSQFTPRPCFKRMASLELHCMCFLLQPTLYCVLGEHTDLSRLCRGTPGCSHNPWLAHLFISFDSSVGRLMNWPFPALFRTWFECKPFTYLLLYAQRKRWARGST